MNIVFWLPGIFAALHIFEEFVWPGGFLDWYRRYRPEISASLTPRFVIVVNAALLAITALLGWMGPTWPRGLSLWLTLMASLVGNAVFHLVGMLRTKRYAPGVVTSLLLYLPLGIWGFGYFIASGVASSRLAISSFAIGSSYQLWSILTHRWRATVA